MYEPSKNVDVISFYYLIFILLLLTSLFYIVNKIGFTWHFYLNTVTGSIIFFIHIHIYGWNILLTHKRHRTAHYVQKWRRHMHEHELSFTDKHSKIQHRSQHLVEHTPLKTAFGSVHCFASITNTSESHVAALDRFFLTWPALLNGINGRTTIAHKPLWGVRVQKSSGALK